MHTPRRADRLFRDGSRWYYHIRDGQRGPFDSRRAAEEDLKRFVLTRDYMDTYPSAVSGGLDIDNVTHIELTAPPRY